MAILERNDKNSVAYILLNSPETLNSLSDEMLAALTTEFGNLQNDTQIRAVVISGAGKAFCAGHNLKEITAARENDDSGEAYFKNLFDACSSLMQLIVSIPQPVIAEVDGVATAAGCQLVASCDLAIASHESKFATPGVNIGLFCSTPMVALSRNVNKKNAMEMLLTGDFINAEKAKEIGLINSMVEKEKLTFEVSKLAEKIASKSSMTVSIGKNAFYAQTEMDLSEAYKYTSKTMTDNLLKHDAKEGINAFIEKRSPNWKDE